MVALEFAPVLAAWGLEQAHVTPVPQGSVNHVYRVESGGGVYFLRGYRHPDLLVALREHALIGQARAMGIEAIAPLPTRDGDSVVRSGQRLFALYPPAPGVQVERQSLTVWHARAAGATLAQLHAGLAPLPDQAYRRYPLSWTGPAWVERLNRVEAAVLQRRERDDTDRWALTRIGQQRAWLADPACPHAFQSAYPPQVIHGDYHDANLFFGASGVSAIIDWEQAAYMPRAFEVVRASAYMFGERAALSRTFCEAYQAHSGMTLDELADGARAWGVMSDHHVWAIEEVYLHGNDRARSFIPHRAFRPFQQVWPEAMAAL